MRKSESIALLMAGNTRLPMLRRLPRLQERIGPLRSTSFRLASRIANALGAGAPVQDWDAFDLCATILISVPDSILCKSIEELVAAPLRWKSKTVLLCASRFDSSALEQLAKR